MLTVLCAVHYQQYTVCMSWYLSNNDFLINWCFSNPEATLKSLNVGLQRFITILVRRTRWRSLQSTSGAAPYTSAVHWHQPTWCTSDTPAIGHFHWSNQYQTLLHHPPGEICTGRFVWKRETLLWIVKNSPLIDCQLIFRTICVYVKGTKKNQQELRRHKKRHNMDVLDCFSLPLH